MTETPTNKNVMLALLALDAYSRGDNPQLKYADGSCRLAFNRGLPHFVWWWSLPRAKRSKPLGRRRISVR